MNLKLKDNELEVFGRIAVRLPNGKWELSGALGRREYNPDRQAVGWVEKFLADKEDPAQNYFVWVNAHVARLFWLSGVITNAHILNAEPCSLVLNFCQEECFICRGVVFSVNGIPVSLDVLVSKRDQNLKEALSMVPGNIPTDLDEMFTLRELKIVTYPEYL